MMEPTSCTSPGGLRAVGAVVTGVNWSPNPQPAQIKYTARDQLAPARVQHLPRGTQTEEVGESGAASCPAHAKGAELESPRHLALVRSPRAQARTRSLSEHVG